MPTPLEENLRAVQLSIVHIKKELEHCTDKNECERIQKLLDEYYAEEQNILKELTRI